MKKSTLVIIAIITFLPSCAYIAIKSAPSKHDTVTRSRAALKADALFWQIFHAGEYEKISNALESMTAAYLDAPNDSVTAAHLGWLHIWRLAERSRLQEIPSFITDDAVLAHKYFHEAVRLNPLDARFLGFLGSSIVAEGTIHKDEKLVREGYYLLVDSISEWPEFNFFTAGYMMSSQPANSSQFQEGLEWQWRNLDVCVDETVDRNNPDFSKYMRLLTVQGNKRVCWNSWIAPHNFEGFFLNMGDMLVKSGDWATAQKIYANARLSADYVKWKFRDVLENRIKNARDNVAQFNDDSSGPSGVKIMFNSSFNCVACHQQ
ncbi:hypothetical protein [Methylocucumis oryzae]|uniref:Tetratricopeptide repeat protein n=1 Tax=Methylocucumis oryzae TaxID=1632867 RepID=A0A0F3IHN0_9GAMM|nr:hypothetical protein [Methylocucumis oryzae]KJV06305.1 hypothetical protein VZ94_12290 [Methylocucumis oryzae]